MAKVTEAEATRVVKFLTTLRANWGKRFESDEAEDQWLDMMIGELHVFSDDVLTAAAKKLMRSRLDFFPRVGQCVDACIAERRFIEGSTPELRDAVAAKSKRTRFDSLADELIMGPVGRKAARDGWVLGLYDFIRREGRMPTEHETIGIVRASREVGDYIDSIWRGDTFTLPADLMRRIATNIQSKRTDLAKRVLGE